MRLRNILTPILCLAAAGPIQAADDAAELAPVVSTATRSPQPLDDLVLPVIVISGEELRQRQVTDLGEALAGVPGIDIGRSGGPGQALSLFVRGTESNHVLVLVDGLRINPGTIGGPNLQHLDPDLVERIEILRGPRAALYGDQAMGGVINIITRAGVGASGGASLRVGADATLGADVAQSVRSGDWALDLALGLERTDGYAFRRGSSEEPGDSNLNLSLGLRHGDAERGTSFRLWQADAATEYLDFFLTPVSQRSTNRTLQLERRDRFGAGWSSVLRFSHALDEIVQDQSPDFVRSERLGIDWLNRIDLGGGRMLGLGLNLEDERARALSFGSGFDESTMDGALYADLLGGGARTDWMLAARYSHYEAAGGELTWNAEVSRRLGERDRVYAAAGSAFRTPDAFDRFGFGGDPDLDPERSLSLELGWVRTLGAGELRASLYRTNIDDLIEFDFGTFTLMNTAEARITGAELAYALHRASWDLRAALVLQRPEDRLTGADLARRSRESLDLHYAHRAGAWTYSADLQLVGRRPDSPFSAVVLGGYGLLDLALSRDLSDGLTLRLRVENAADAHYQTADGFLGRPRSLFISLDYRPGQGWGSVSDHG